MGFVTNEHVERMALYQPFDASFSQLYAEYVDTLSSDQLTTKAYAFVDNAIRKPTTRLIVLTGDAGHGKTHLCGQLIASLTGSAKVRTVLREYGNGELPVAKLPDGRELHLMTDLSAIDQDRAAPALEERLNDDGAVTVVCANEGRLREVISRSPALNRLQAALDHVLKSGQTTLDDQIWVVNLNFQSVTSANGNSLVRQALGNWLLDQRKWSPCERCDAKDRCPIYANRALLADPTEHGTSRREAVEVLLRLVEQTGYVVTIRELLVFIAHVITAELRCRDVHQKVQSTTADDWQHSYLFHQAAFGTRLGPRELDRLEVFRAARQLDPGIRAIRQVDDDLRIESDTGYDRFSPPTGRADSTPRNRTEMTTRERQQVELYRFLRRRDYFDALGANNRRNIAFSERLGFLHYDGFATVASEQTASAQVDTRNLVLSGLEAVQGARRSTSQAPFAVIDPAFSAHRGTASVVATQITRMKIRLVSQTTWWAEDSGTMPDLNDAVDWIDRSVFVLIPDSTGTIHPIELDCRQFELIGRAAQGLTAREFYQAEIRRIGSQLGAIGAAAPATDEITVLVKGKPSKIVIDVGDVIVVAD